MFKKVLLLIYIYIYIYICFSNIHTYIHIYIYYIYKSLAVGRLNFRCSEHWLAQALSWFSHSDLLPPTGHSQYCIRPETYKAFAQLRIRFMGIKMPFWKGLQRSSLPPLTNEKRKIQRGGFSICAAEASTREVALKSCLNLPTPWSQ